MDDIKVENKKIIEDLIEINLNIFVSQDEENIKNFKEISKIDKKIINLTLLNEKILIGEDILSSIFQMIEIEEKK